MIISFLLDSSVSVQLYFRFLTIVMFRIIYSANQAYPYKIEIISSFVNYGFKIK